MKLLKYIFDRTTALIGLLFLWPVLLVVALLIKCQMPGPVLFVQQRVGQNGVLFNCHKFRSMTTIHGGSSVSVAGEARITQLGAKLRKYKLDELPELFNIAKGDMAIIGPRPLLLSYLPFYRGKEKTRHDVRPGLSGLAQVSGRNYIAWDDRLANDAEYV